MRFGRAYELTLFFVVPLCLSSCDNHINAAGFGGTSDGRLVLDMAKAHALETLIAYRARDRRELWGDFQFRGTNTVVIGLLISLRSEEARRAYLENYLDDDETLDRWISALRRSTFSITSNRKEILVNGEPQDAVTREYHVTFYEPTQNMLRSAVTGQIQAGLNGDLSLYIMRWLHETGHMPTIAFEDEEPVGPYPTGRQFLSELGAGFVAHYYGRKGTIFPEVVASDEDEAEENRLREQAAEAEARRAAEAAQAAERLAAAEREAARRANIAVVYRYKNIYTGKYFYTKSQAEGGGAYPEGYRLEGDAFYVYLIPEPTESGAIALYRCYARSHNIHFISLDPGCEGWESYGVIGFAANAPSAHTVALDRFWNGNTHLSTTNPSEGAGWADMGGQGFVPTGD